MNPIRETIQKLIVINSTKECVLKSQSSFDKKGMKKSAEERVLF